MNEDNNSVLCIDKILDNNYSMLEEDYKMLTEIYPEDIKEINNNEEELSFLLKLKYQIEIQESTIDLLISMKLDDLLDNNEANCMYLPYWIKIFYSKEQKNMKISIFVYWFKYKKELKNELQNILSKDIDEPILYNIIDESKNVIENSLNNKQMLIEILNEIRDLMALKVSTNTDNFLFVETGANIGIENFNYKNDNLMHNSNHNEHHNDKKYENHLNEKLDKEDKEKNNYDYEKFLKDKGFVGETIIDRASIFQAHAIKIKNKEEDDFYKKCLLNQKKIKKATHNITIYRLIDKETKQIIEDYNDDGEDGAGYRLLGIIQKMKLVNLFVMVSRWYGGVLLHQDRFKRINDSAKNLLNAHLDEFEICK